MNEIDILRHSCAHILASAIAKLWPDAQFAAGPAVEIGFYYDVDLAHRISPDDFSKIEEEMARQIKANHRFERIELSRTEALKMAESGELASLGPREKPSVFKADIISHLPDNEVITIYKSGEFTDLCAGPHVSHTGRIGAFKLTHVASAYYKGDEKNPQLQRIYGTAFKNKTQMAEYFAMLEEAKKRDHRKIGAEMGLFAIDAEYVGPGLPLWLPKGTVLVEELERLAKETEFAAGYVRVRTPHLAKEKMYKTSGHLPYYEESMFPAIEIWENRENCCCGAEHGKKENAGEGEKPEKYYIKSMNCPHHHRIFAAEPRSYRDLPLRMAEYGYCYRYEQSGELFGLMRVRSMQMNDAHIYCTEEQFEKEFHAVNEMYLKYFKLFGLGKYVMRFSTHDPARLGQKFVDEPELWLKTESMVRSVLQRSGINYVEIPNEAAFYGPKIDVQVWSAIGREFTLATNQVDFVVPGRFGLTYRDRDNTEKTPLCIHRAPLGTHERFIGFLIEHYAGNFPLWLAPEQVRICTLGAEESLVKAAQALQANLLNASMRATLDVGTDKLNGKLQKAEIEKVHTMIVIGPRDLEAGKVSVRIHGKGNIGAFSQDVVEKELIEAYRNRRELAFQS